MRAAAFDLSSMSGIAFWNGVDDKPLLERKRIMFWDRGAGRMLEAWRVWLGEEVFKKHNPELVGIEAAAYGAHGDKTTEDKQAQIRGLLLWACHVKGIPAYEYSPGTWRKSFIGYGKRRDGDPEWKVMAKRRCDALGWKYPDHNAAEAGGVLDHLLIDNGIVAPWRRPTAEARAAFLPLPELFPDA